VPPRRRTPRWIALLIALTAAGATLSSSATAATRALIVIGLTADAEHAARLRAQAEAARQGFLLRGFAAANLQLLAPADGAPVKRDAILAAFKATAALATPEDETWILLLGHSAAGRDGTPAFQVSGPRVSANDLAGAVGALPGKKFVVVATAKSGGFLPPLLALPGVEAVAATAESGEINEPRLAETWVAALTARPWADFRELATEAATRVAASYERESLAPGEHAQIIDRQAGEIVAVPVAPPNPAAANPAPK
jgi:hypothetical protein